MDIWHRYEYFLIILRLLTFWEATDGIVVWYWRREKSGQLLRKFPFKLTTSNIKPYLFNVFSIDSLTAIQSVAIKVSAQRDPLCERGPQLKWRSSLRLPDYFLPAQWVRRGEASRSAAPCCAEAEHNECGGRQPQQSRGRGCLGTRGPWPAAKHIRTQILLHTCGFLRKQFS